MKIVGIVNERPVHRMLESLGVIVTFVDTCSEAASGAVPEPREKIP
jgi:hypothetical protein